MTNINETVGFTSMAEGTREDYALLDRLEARFAESTADRVLDQLRRLAGSLSGYKIDRLEHSLQAATRAYRDGADEEMVVAALLHDIGDLLSPYNHSELAAAVLRPYVSEKTYWIVRHHGLFQSYYYATTRAATATLATPTAITRGTRTRWTSATAGTSPPSTRSTNLCRWSSSSRWCGGFSRESRSAKQVGDA